jgi:hypothetical protein
MHPKLEDGIYPFPKLLFKLSKRIEVRSVENEGFFTDGVRANPERKANMGIVEIIGRGDTDIVDLAVTVHPAEFLDMAVKSFKLSKKICIREIVINNPDRVIFINGCDKEISGFFDRLHMARRYKSTRSNKSKVFTHVLKILLDEILDASLM